MAQNCKEGTCVARYWTAACCFVVVILSSNMPSCGISCFNPSDGLIGFVCNKCECPIHCKCGVNEGEPLAPVYHSLLCPSYQFQKNVSDAPAQETSSNNAFVTGNDDDKVESVASATKQTTAMKSAMMMTAKQSNFKTTAGENDGDATSVSVPLKRQLTSHQGI